MTPIAALPDLANVIGPIVGLVAAAATVAFTFSKGRALYDIESGGFKVQLKEAGESAGRAETVASAKYDERLEADLERLVSNDNQLVADHAEELARRIVGLVRAENAVSTQAA